MLYSEYCRGKLFQNKIGGPSKPFIDQNLQLQLPEWDFSSGHHCSLSPIYAHYAGSSPSPSVSLQVNEAEIYHAIHEAECSYDSWKQMKQKVNALYSSNSASASKN